MARRTVLFYAHVHVVSKQLIFMQIEWNFCHPSIFHRGFIEFGKSRQ